MVDVIIRGIGGHMGRNVLELVENEEDMRCVAGVDIRPVKADVPVYASFADVREKADVVIDFSSADGLEDELSWAERTGCALVLASTGYSEADLRRIDRCANTVAVFKTANLSVGVNILQALVRQAAAALGEQFDIEIVEKHHHFKKDAPSGTALMLAESANEAFAEKKHYVCGREGMVGARTQSEIGIHAVRGGTIVGEHEVIFAGEDEIVTLSHSARSKRVFAAGAVRAARFVCGKPAGKYDMHDVIAR